MKPEQARRLLRELLDAISYPNGMARTDDFAGLRQVDAKVREGQMIIAALPGFGERLAKEMEADEDFLANSRRVRLEALGNYCRSAERFLSAGVMRPEKKKLFKAPNTAHLTAVFPQLDEVIQERWLEAQRCQHASAYFAAVVLMGSILEALLLARVHLSPAEANRASAAPKNRSGSVLAFHDWSLSSLIDVAAELRWIKVDRKSFGHALRDSRNVIHPWYHVQVQADYDRATCEMCWHVLRASVDDLLVSLPAAEREPNG